MVFHVSEVGESTIDCHSELAAPYNENGFDTGAIIRGATARDGSHPKDTDNSGESVFHKDRWSSFEECVKDTAVYSCSD